MSKGLKPPSIGDQLRRDAEVDDLQKRVQERHHANRARAEQAPPEREWIGWAVCLDGPNGWRRVRVRLPESVVLTHAMGEIEAPDLLPIVAERIRNEVTSDQVISRKGW